MPRAQLGPFFGGVDLDTAMDKAEQKTAVRADCGAQLNFRARSDLGRFILRRRDGLHLAGQRKNLKGEEIF